MGRWGNASRDRPVRMQVNDTRLDTSLLGRCLVAYAQERRDAPAVVRVPVREDDAIDLLGRDFQRGNIASDAARLWARVEKSMVNLAFALPLSFLR